MSTFQVLFLLFILIPLLEIYLLITVGSVIGAWYTVFLVVSTAIIGAFLVRQQGISTLFRVQNTIHSGELPATALLEGVLILIAGALLLTPGFVTDTIGFVFLVPPWRQTIVSLIFQRMEKRSSAQFRVYRDAARGQDHRTTSVIEGRFRREDDE